MIARLPSAPSLPALCSLQAEAWAGAESTLHQRIADAETRAATAAEKERMALERCQVGIDEGNKAGGIR